MYRLRRPSGMVLVVILCLAALLSLCITTLARASIHSLNLAAQGNADRQAWYTAEAGLYDAARTLKTGSVTGYSNKALPSNSKCTYTVIVTNNSSGSNPTAPDGTSVPTGCVYFRSTGTVPGSVSRAVSALAHSQSNGINWGLFGATSVTMSGNSYVDGWNSQNGTVAYSAPTLPSAPRKDAPIGTNGTAAGAISLGSNDYVDGNVYYPTTGSSNTVSNSGSVYGTVSTENAVTLAPVSPPAVTVNSGSLSYSGGTTTLSAPPAGTAYKDLAVSGQAVLVLNPGTYHFTGNIQISGQAQVKITAGPVIIYVDDSDGSSTLSGGGYVNTTNYASNLQFYFSGTRAVTVSGNGQAYGVVYAPQAALTASGNGDIYGSLIGATVTMSGNGAVHYDTSLQSLNGGGSGGGGSYSLTAFHRW